MNSDEVYKEYFEDEEYDLSESPYETYSYQAGWNFGLKRASIIIASTMKDFKRVKNTSLDKVGKVCEVCVFRNKTFERACEDCRNHDQFLFDGYVKKEAGDKE